MARRRNDKSREVPSHSILRLAEQEELLDEPKIQQLVQLAAITDNRVLASNIEKIVAAKAAQSRIQPFQVGSLDGSSESEPISLGSGRQGMDYSIDQDTLTQHLLAVGQSGAGKTTLLMNMMDQLTVPFWSFDLKQDYRHLIQNGQEDLLVLPWTEFTFNPLKPPPGVPPRRWAQVFGEIFGHATALLSGSKNYLMKQIVHLYELYDLFDEVSAPYPSLYELQEIVRRDKINYVRKLANYRDTVLNRLEAMTLTAGTVFSCSEGLSVPELLNQNVVFEFDGLGRDVQNFLMEILFAAVYEYRIAQNQRGSGLRHVFFLDEGKRVFSVYKERQDASGIPAIDELTAKMREFGEGLVVADQEATKLTDSIKANTYTKVLLATGDHRQLEEMRNSMYLTDRQASLAEQLDIGEAVIQAGNRDPVPVYLRNVDLDKQVSTEEVVALQQEEWESLNYEPRKITLDFLDQVRREQEENEVLLDIAAIELFEDAERLLMQIVEHPYKSVSEHYQELPSAERGKGAKEELLDSGLVEVRQVQAQTRHKNLFELTDRGKAYLEETGIDVEFEGRGGVVHRYWQHRIKETLEEFGWTVKLELFHADVYANLDGTEIVIEVAMGNNAREVDHVKRHLAKQFDEVWMVCRNTKVRDGIQERLEENGVHDDRLIFRTVQDFLDPVSLPFE